MRNHAASEPLAQRSLPARLGLKSSLDARLRSSSVSTIIILATAITLAGCASSGGQYQSSGVTRHAAVQPPMPRPRIEIEDDGQPVQTPPARLPRPEDDDPSQPWSPNYGRGAAPQSKRTAEAVIAPPRVPTSTAPEPRSPIHPAVRPLSEDEIVARAVAMHEMNAQRR